MHRSPSSAPLGNLLGPPNGVWRFLQLARPPGVKQPRRWKGAEKNVAYFVTPKKIEQWKNISYHIIYIYTGTYDLDLYQYHVISINVTYLYLHMGNIIYIEVYGWEKTSVQIGKSSSIKQIEHCDTWKYEVGQRKSRQVADNKGTIFVMDLPSQWFGLFSQWKIH